MSGPTRRDLIKTAAILPAAARIPAPSTPKPAAGSRPLVISSANGLKAVEKAYAVLSSGGDPVEAVVSGVNIVEDDPEDVTVGYGGIPNEEGVVELDSSVMDGRVMKAGAVAALHNIKNPSRVAQLVMNQTNRCMIVGEGALRFAKSHGFPEMSLLTERSRKIWLYWKENSSSNDDWLPSPAEAKDPDILWYIDKYGDEDFRPQGTINCDCVTADGDLAGVTTTSGLFFKIPGRVGDSPIIGAGLYVDNEVGAAGSTGWGEGNIRVVGAHTILELMRQGKSPQEACLATLERVVRLAKEAKRDAKNRPMFQLHYYAVAKDGRYGSAAIWSGEKNGKGEIVPSQCAVCDAKGPRLEKSAFLYTRD
ncbi:MAG TPA: N(4)-(beta-N-acetylglucosaminyl)-L-asparaginase [Thermoanaerobaculia bacterium]|nr:N(4)-(beta-N-acetylglucosaminyl)-L-asparaginase [Thermoanaerobaculia bacterium]